MRRALILLIILNAGIPALSEPESIPIGFASPLKNMMIPDTGTGELPRAVAGTRLPSPALAENGYTVLCRDSEGQLRMALIPVRDRLGRATARAWTTDSALEKNTVFVKKSIQLQAGNILLQPDQKYPVLRQDENTYTILYRFQDFSRELPLAKAEVQFEPAGAHPKDRGTREKQLANQLTQLLREQETLETRLREARENTSRLAGFLRQIAILEIKRKRLTAEISGSEATYRKLMDDPSKPDPSIRELEQRLAQSIQAQGLVAADLEKSQRDTEVVKTLQDQVLTAEMLLIRLKSETEKRQAELAALLAHEKDKDFKAEKQRMVTLVRRADSALADVAGQLQGLRTSKDILALLQTRMESTSAETGNLQQQLDQLSQEMEALRNATNPTAEPAPEP